MARIKGRDTAPEILVRRLLHALGYRFRLHRRDLPGCPDIVLPRHHTVIFVHGCFWHCHAGCPRATLPVRNAEFWRAKLEGNRARDIQHASDLASAGWQVLVVWQCEIRDWEALRTRLMALR